MTTWRKEIEKEMNNNGDAWEDIVESVIDGDFDKGFDGGYGGTEGANFTVWTKEYVYFPICYDGSEWCGSAPRNPNGKALSHQGGG